jgi:DNA mismatch repair protein MutL
MSKIKIMPEALIGKIAAGEVVERPASVVKELLENSLDAGARKVSIVVESGGKRLIRVVDDGEGMARDDAILAFERHATSKLRSVEDLDNISTLGFRGEALPSIAAVSRVVLRTRSAGEIHGTEVRLEGGKLLSARDIAWSSGTEVEVRELFFNVPARRKFLKGDATENAHIVSIVQHYALANPGIAFLLIRDGRELINAPAAPSLRDRAYQVLGAELLEKLIEINHRVESVRVFGFASNPQEQRSSRDAQYFFVNGRFVRDQLIGRALGEAYRSMMPQGAYPAAILFIELPPSEVDVNVHPAKTHVRFLREPVVASAIREAVLNGLRSSRPIVRVKARFEPGFAAPSWVDLQKQRPLELSFAVQGSQPVASADPAGLPGLGGRIRPLGQIRASYIVATDDEALLLIDQHVAHERILFEQLFDRGVLGTTQRLLIAETLDLSPAEAEAFLAISGELEQLGIEAAQLSGRTIAIKAVPAGISPEAAIAAVREVLSGIGRRQVAMDRLREQIAAEVACKAAIKINTPLADQKMQWLIEELLKARNPMTCPHGRPIIVRVDLRQIERSFKRP